MFDFVVSIPEPQRRLVQVSMSFQSLNDDELELVFPVWTPGSYMVREHQRFINDLDAFDGKGSRLPLRKVAKNRYVLKPSGVGRVELRYEVYAHQLTVRTNHVDSSHAFLNPVAMLPYVEGRQAERQRLKVQNLPEGWGVACALDEVEGWFEAADYDELADSPLECGRHARKDARLSFEVEGIPHEIVIWGRGPDNERLVKDTKTIVQTQAKLFGGLPYERYLIILHVSKGYGGLEHRASTALLYDRDAIRTERGYEDFLSLVSHELFHVWNVKRIKPAVFTPYNLNRENYTRLLWVFEGFTSYYQDLFLVRAGLISQERWLQIIGEMLTRLAGVEGRKRQSVAEASFDAWIRLYLRDEETDNSTVSYYLKGALVALSLDLELRRLSEGKFSLDDVVRVMWSRYGQTGVGIPEDEAEELIEELAQKAVGASIKPLLQRLVHSTEELELDTQLAAHGLELKYRNRSSESDRGGVSSSTALSCYVGVHLKKEGQTVSVASVQRASPADYAGLCPGDEIVAIDGLKASPARAFAMLHERKPGDKVELSVFRLEELTSLSFIAAEPRKDVAVLSLSESAADAQKALLQSWTGEQKGPSMAAKERAS